MGSESSVAAASICSSRSPTTAVEVRRSTGASSWKRPVIFNAAIGERITAVSSGVGCTLRVDEAQLTGQASCAVLLSSIRVDNDDTKSDHFRQWATNKKVDPKKCAFKLEVPHLKLEGPVEAMKPVPFEAEGTFTICGRPRDDKGAETISGTILYLPPGSYRDVRTLRIRAKIE